MSQSKTKSWRCVLCGYIHHGDSPPDECPVCGAPASEFEPFEDASAAKAAPVVKKWLCLDCGYIHEGPEPPDECPVCGSPKDRFEALPDEKPGAVAVGAIRVVIIGAGIAGVSAAEAVRRNAPDAVITLVSREADYPYYRINLTRYLAGEITETDLRLHPENWYRDQRIDLLLGADATEILAAEKTVVLQDGRRLPYDKLIFAAGAHSFVPPIPGADKPGVTSLRTKADADMILAALAPGLRVVCIGGGILGLEAAGALARRGANVTVLEGFPWLMPRQLNKTAGERLQTFVEKLGISMRLSVRIKEITGSDRAQGVLLEDGSVCPADLVVLSAGVRSNTHLARSAGLETANGVVVNNHLATSNTDILAVGDVAEHAGVVYGLWGPALYQGGIAGMNAAGDVVEFGGLPRSNTLKVLGLDLFSIGKIEPDDGSYIIVEEDSEARSLRFMFRDNKLVGAILLGDASAAAGVKKAVESGVDLSGLLVRDPGAGFVMNFLRG